MLSSLSSSSLGPCSSPGFRSAAGRVGSLEPRTLASLAHGSNAGAAALGKVVFSLAPDDRMALWVVGASGSSLDRSLGSVTVAPLLYLKVEL